MRKSMHGAESGVAASVSMSMVWQPWVVVCACSVGNTFNAASASLSALRKIGTRLVGTARN
jgi:hypothetical protein